MERAAWLVLALAFLLFIGLVAVLSVRVGDVVSHVEAPSTIDEISGVVLVRQGDLLTQGSISAGEEVFQGDHLHVSFGSTARLRMFEGSTIELFPDTNLRIDRARAARIGGRQAEAQLGIETGTARIAVAPASPDARMFELVTPAGVARLEPGEYTVRVSDEATRISVWAGKAVMLVERQVVDIPVDTKIILEGDGKFRLVHVLEDVLVNGRFTDRTPTPPYAREGPGWYFFDEQTASDARGQIAVEVPRDSGAPGVALRFTRQSASQTHNETGVRQIIHRDVAGAHSMMLDLWVKVDYALLSGGGYLGSEYPVMIRIRYSTLRGGEQVWTQGFYYDNPEGRPAGFGDQQPQKEWKYIVKDLTQLLPNAVTIEEIQVLAAGHTYDSSVAEIRLLVD